MRGVLFKWPGQINKFRNLLKGNLRKVIIQSTVER